MESEDLVVGLDIGTSKVCAAAGYVQNNGITLVGFVEKEILPIDEVLKNGEIENASRTIEVIDQILEELANNLELNLEALNVNISNVGITGQIKNGKITVSGGKRQIFESDTDKLFDDVKMIYKAQPGRVILHSLPMDFYLDEVKANEKVVGKFGLQVGGDFYFLTTKTDALDKLYYTLKNIKAKTDGAKSEAIHVDNIVLSSIADAMVLLDSKIDDKRNGVALVNIGAELTEISIFHKHSIRHYKAIGIAGNSINEDLMKAFNINFDEAEMLKKIAGNIPAKSIGDTEVLVLNRREGLAPVEILLKNALTVIEWRLKEIAALVKVELVKSGFENSLTNGIILTGGTASMGLIKEVFVEVTKIKSIRKGKMNAKINFNGFEKLNKPKYSTVLGLLLAGSVDFDSRIDNRILKHSPFNEPSIEIPAAEKRKPSKVETPKRSLFDRMKNFIKDDNMDDNYN